MPDRFRLIVTGSRTWDDPDAVYAALAAVQHGHRDRTLVVVHGKARRGADDLAATWARAHGVCGGVIEEPHAADWDRHGKRAGFIRNEHMVSLGADLCLCFVMLCADPKCRRKGPHDTHGTANCVSLARKAGIPVKEIRP